MHLRWGLLRLEPAQRLLFPSPSHPCNSNCHKWRTFSLIICSVMFYNLDCRPRALDTRRSKLWPSFPTSCVIVRNHPSFVGSSLASSVSWSRKKIMIIISLHHLERSSSTSWSLLFLLICPYNHYNHRIKFLLHHLFADQVHRADGEERVINKSCHIIRTKHFLSLCCVLELRYKQTFYLLILFTLKVIGSVRICRRL